MIVELAAWDATEVAATGELAAALAATGLVDVGIGQATGAGALSPARGSAWPSAAAGSFASRPASRSRSSCSCSVTRALTARTRSRLLRIRAALDGVTPAKPAASLRVPPSTRLNAHYTTALALARLILQGSGISTQTGAVTSSTFSFDMNAVFEDFLTRALGDAVGAHGAQLVAQDDRRHLDAQRTLLLKPDMTIWRRGGCTAVLDAKYKPLTAPGFPNADAYQMLAYCTAYGLDHGTLVYAKDALGEPRTHTIRGAGVTIDVRALDVAKPHRELLAEVDALAASVLARCAAAA